MDKYVSVIGGAHVKVSATSFGRLIGEDDMGVISLSLGGVARNLSEKLSLMGINVKLITALGKDGFASEIMSACNKKGIDYSYSLITDDPTSIVTEISDERREKTFKVLDQRVLRNMDMDFFVSRLDVLNGSAACFIDTEFDFDKLEFLCQNITCPIFIDTVSVKESSKLKGVLKYIHTIKPNKAELENLVGFSLENENNFRAATELILQAGTKNVFVTCGKEGVWFNDGINFGHIDAGDEIFINKAGVGDVFKASLIKSFLANDGIKASAQSAVQASVDFLTGVAND